MSEPDIITTKDGRQYRKMPNGSLERVSIVKLNAKQRKKLYAKMRAAVQDTTAISTPAPEAEPETSWMNSEERQRLLKETRKDYE